MENGKLKTDIKFKIIQDRLKQIFNKKPKAVAKILTHLIKRSKSV